MNPSKKNNLKNEQILLLERLSNACSVSGDEQDVRQIVLEEIKSHIDQYKIDPLGNLLAVKKPKKSPALKVMLAAHMDEVGLMISDKGENGLFRFEKVGGIQIHQIIGKPVFIGRDKIPGVIGTRPIHLVKKDELEQAIQIDQLRIDIGADSNSKVKPGDYVTFATSFQVLGTSMIGKAFDDRLGVATLIEIIKNSPPGIELLAAFTVQEELGLRGAGVAAHSLKPDLAVVLDATPAYDMPVWDDTENHQYNTRLGLGPALYVADSATLSDPRLIRHFVETAKENNLRYQIRQPGGGGTDAGAIHTRLSGIPAISISVPTRYIHSPASLAQISDWNDTAILIQAGLENLNDSTLSRN